MTSARRCEDGPCGELGRVVADPIKRAVAHLVVEPHHRDALARLVPTTEAEAALHEGRAALACKAAARKDTLSSQSRKSFSRDLQLIGLAPERPLELRDPPPLLSGKRTVLARLEALHARLDHLVAPPPQKRL